jgi:cell division protein FtsN
MRDYSKPPPKPRAKQSSGNGLFVGLGLGLFIGVVGSAGFYFIKLKPSNAEITTVKPPVPQSARDDLPTKESSVPPPANSGFTFYDQLKTFSVKIPDKESDAQRDLKPSLETRPGSYILQAGSYGTVEEAEHKRSQLSAMGVDSHIQAAVYENEKYYRVKIGPIQNLDQLNSIRETLRKNRVDATMARVSD